MIKFQPCQCECICHKVGLLGFFCCPCSAGEIEKMVTWFGPHKQQPEPPAATIEEHIRMMNPSEERAASGSGTATSSAPAYGFTQWLTDVANLRFYAEMAEAYEWHTQQIHHGVIVSTLREIADRVELSAKPEPQGGKEADPARERTETQPVVSAMGASSPSGASGLLAPQSPRCPKCGSGNILLWEIGTRPTQHLIAKCESCKAIFGKELPGLCFRTDFAQFFPSSSVSPKELAGRIAKRIYDWHFEPAMNSESEPAQKWRKEVAEIIEQELTR